MKFKYNPKLPTKTFPMKTAKPKREVLKVVIDCLHAKGITATTADETISARVRCGLYWSVFTFSLQPIDGGYSIERSVRAEATLLFYTFMLLYSAIGGGFIGALTALTLCFGLIIGPVIVIMCAPPIFAILFTVPLLRASVEIEKLINNAKAVCEAIQ